ncbi:hypothetical protein T492DRAFT_965040 [Pavlovales sp. CCMP2436]|nr:hypothetical protein T492DRAFT_965040 [Pavlovales sp. CCMP2436]
MLSSEWEHAYRHTAVAESKPNQIMSLCGIAADASSVDLSERGLDAADAVLLVFELHINTTVTELDLISNEIASFSKDVLREAWQHGSGLTRRRGQRALIPLVAQGSSSIAANWQRSRNCLSSRADMLMTHQVNVIANTRSKEGHSSCV